MLKFYKYGLSKVGWNKYSYIDVELDNQIVCTLRHEVRKEDTSEPEVPEADKAQPRKDRSSRLRLAGTSRHLKQDNKYNS